MRRPIQALKSATPFMSGILIGTAIVTPVFAATSVTPEGIQPLLLIGSVVVLLVALALQAVATRQTRRERGMENGAHAPQSDAGPREEYGTAGDGVYISRHVTGAIGDYRVAPRWNSR